MMQWIGLMNVNLKQTAKSFFAINQSTIAFQPTEAERFLQTDLENSWFFRN